MLGGGVSVMERSVAQLARMFGLLLILSCAKHCVLARSGAFKTGYNNCPFTASNAEGRNKMVAVHLQRQSWSVL
jgi:hypothetical protein